MTIFKLSIAACVALMAGVWAEGTKANETGKAGGLTQQLVGLSQSQR
jgi:hypothetical protein